MNTIEALQIPIDNIRHDNIQKTFCEIAYNLFNYFCIQCCEKRYDFAEIEFYYYDKKSMHDQWTQVTYPRDGYKVGSLFYHLSGIDICFNSSYNAKDNLATPQVVTTTSDSAKYGGILIRALKNEKGELIAGPLTCKDELLNACRGRCMPQLKDFNRVNPIEPSKTKRVLGKKSQTNEDASDYVLCFYDETIKDLTQTKIRYIKNSNGKEDEIVKINNKYNRFKKNDN